MRRCPNCGNMEPESSKFCSVCGASMEGAVRQNPFRTESSSTSSSAGSAASSSSDEEPTVVLNSEEAKKVSSQTENGEKRAYTEADSSSGSTGSGKSGSGNTGSGGGKNGGKKKGGKKKWIVLVIVIVALVVLACIIFVFATLSSGSSDDSAETSSSMIQSDSDLTDIFSEETESVETEAEETEEVEEESEEPTESAEESEEVSESPEESAEESEEVSESPEESEEVSESPEESTSGSTTSKTYDGVTITTDYVIADSDSTYLTESDLEGLSEQELKIARNEIFARHGRLFDDSELQAYFDSCSWYNGTIDPDDFDSSEMLNEYELENVSTIRAYEDEMGYN